MERRRMIDLMILYCVFWGAIILASAISTLITKDYAKKRGDNNDYN